MTFDFVEPLYCPYCGETLNPDRNNKGTIYYCPDDNCPLIQLEAKRVTGLGHVLYPRFKSEVADKGVDAVFSIGSQQLRKETE